jgi:hypothetical protein
MRVDDLELADVILHAVKVVDERPAHVVDFIHEVGIEREWAAMIVDAVNAVVMRLAVTLASEYVYLMRPTLQGRRQLGYVDAYTAHGDGMKRFP